MSPATVSEISSGKRRVTLKMALRISEQLNLSPQEKERLVETFQSEKVRPLPRRELVFHQLKEDEFQLIADWQHFAILSLLKIAPKKATQISTALSLSMLVTQKSLERLVRLDLIKQDKNRVYHRVSKPISTSDGVSSLAIRKSHLQDLDFARTSLEQDDLELRDFTSVTLAIDEKRLPEAKKIIRDFRDRLMQFLEKDSPKSVYKFSIQLYPLTRGKK